MPDSFDVKYQEHLDFVACGCHDRFEGFDRGDRCQPHVAAGGEWTAADEEWLCFMERIISGGAA